MRIAVDHREASSRVPECLQRISEVNTQMAALSVGDYQIEDQVVFERKTLLDFAQSIKDGRLFKQAERLSLCNMKAACIIEGTSKDMAASMMSRESMQGALISLSLIWGIPVLRSMSPEETAKLIVYAGRQLEWAAHGGIKRSGYRPKSKRKRQLYILQGLPGIGPERAEALLNHFGSVAAVTQAAVEEMEKLDGIGLITAQHICDAVHEKQVRYPKSDCREMREEFDL